MEELRKSYEANIENRILKVVKNQLESAPSKTLFTINTSDWYPTKNDPRIDGEIEVLKRVLENMKCKVVAVTDDEREFGSSCQGEMDYRNYYGKQVQFSLM